LAAFFAGFFAAFLAGFFTAFLAGFFAAFLAAFFLTGIQNPPFRTAVAGLEIAFDAPHMCVRRTRVHERQRFFDSPREYFSRRTMPVGALTTTGGLRGA
jgi:hypothetical protein